MAHWMLWSRQMRTKASRLCDRSRGIEHSSALRSRCRSSSSFCTLLRGKTQNNEDEMLVRSAVDSSALNSRRRSSSSGCNFLFDPEN